ncbi:MAG: hypothetical protein QM831_24310 [Kofleriaceae bacterium]
MRAVVLVALVGCGRLGFDDDRTRTDAAVDAALIDAGVTHGAPTFVTDDDQIGGMVTAVTATLSGVTDGDLLVVAIGYDENMAIMPTLSDTLGTTFTLLGPDDGGASNRQYIAYGILHSGATIDTFTVSLSAAAASYVELRPHAYRGVDPATPFDTHVTTKGTAPGQQPLASITTAVDNELVFAFGITNNGSTVQGFDMTPRTTGAGDLTEDKIAPTAGAQTVTASSDAGVWTFSVAAFRGPAM